jgi:hypothetical protein
VKCSPGRSRPSSLGQFCEVPAVRFRRGWIPPPRHRRASAGAEPPHRQLRSGLSKCAPFGIVPAVTIRRSLLTSAEASDRQEEHSVQQGARGVGGSRQILPVEDLPLHGLAVTEKEFGGLPPMHQSFSLRWLQNANRSPSSTTRGALTEVIRPKFAFSCVTSGLLRLA